MQYHLFGAASPSGEAFKKCLESSSLNLTVYSYSRSSDYNHADFNNPHTFFPAGSPSEPSVWISFGPIWLLAPFIDYLVRNHPARLHGLQGVIACSSSSVLTKRYASNQFDRDLVVRLTESEDKLLSACERLDIRCHILQPTLVYGKVGTYCDSNLSLLLKCLQNFPFMLLPAKTGLRQPIHAFQLASVAIKLAEHIYKPSLECSYSSRIPLGGDTTLSYTDMIRALQQAQPSFDNARFCRLIPIPNRLFFFLFAPLLLYSPKSYEALLRIAADLSSFTPSNHILDTPPYTFPFTYSR